tara:strand:+ start:104 stop:445 length:342 start_codon:yes stop_codon:yes gene_type:complete
MANLLGWLLLAAALMIGYLAVDHIVSKRREDAEIRREKRGGLTPPAGYNFQYDYSQQLAKIVHGQGRTMSQMAVTLERILNTLKDIEQCLNTEHGQQNGSPRATKESSDYLTA